MSSAFADTADPLLIAGALLVVNVQTPDAPPSDGTFLGNACQRRSTY
ncbi:hypothetical protein FRAAL0350 [Frankia alni ACN14a]|uniref:Uncharacterized protein n=1 Tax=Frankia alni (strain DSM 45986 / CECT 9034 / ACN14a) TaxID=326424 RepID=Q0RTS2_FRAAA|nr:hypothetical protein FRAAL0350 [Frankia alni ACN14a]